MNCWSTVLNVAGIIYLSCTIKINARGRDIGPQRRDQSHRTGLFELARKHILFLILFLTDRVPSSRGYQTFRMSSGRSRVYNIGGSKLSISRLGSPRCSLGRYRDRTSRYAICHLAPRPCIFSSLTSYALRRRH